MGDRLLTVAEVAESCQVHGKTVMRAIARGELRAVRLGARGAYRIRPGDVDAWLDERVVRPTRRFVREHDQEPAGRLVA
jgi:excisionase family DNA binding protein